MGASVEAKYADGGLHKTMAFEMAGFNITADCIAPGCSTGIEMPTSIQLGNFLGFCKPSQEILAQS